MDFGIARAIADTAATMTQTQAVVGTAQYLSPEQAQGQTVDARSDLYSTGCLLFELLTGRPPFVGDSPVAIAYQHVGELPQPPSVLQRRRRRRPRRRHPARAGQGPRGPLPGRRRLPGRPRERPARPADQRGGRSGTAAAVGAAATQTLRAVVCPRRRPDGGAVPTRGERRRHGGLPAVGHDEDDATAGRQAQGRARHRARHCRARPRRLGCRHVVQQPDAGRTSRSPCRRSQGMNEDAALSALRTANLRARSRPRPSTTVTEGDVISQDPAAGTQVAESRSSSTSCRPGPDSVTVPDVTGFDKDAARADARGRRASTCRASPRRTTPTRTRTR